ncbi:hypothetical protein M3665_28275 [Bacillus licheniformis]|nr:hypothetical protein [Bacillus licheniformis]
MTMQARLSFARWHIVCGIADGMAFTTSAIAKISGDAVHTGSPSPTKLRT